MIDLSDTILSDSDFLTADDVRAQPIIVKIARVDKKSSKVVHIYFEGDVKPWNTNKTSRRLLAIPWGTDGENYIGKTIRLYCDPKFRWQGKEVGGVCVNGMMEIERGFTAELTVSQGGIARQFRIDKLAAPKPANLHAFLDESGITMGQLDAFFASKGKPLPSEMDEAKQSAVAVRLADSPDVVAEVRAIGGGE